MFVARGGLYESRSFSQHLRTHIFKLAVQPGQLVVLDLLLFGL
jgi:hypothetical protein